MTLYVVTKRNPYYRTGTWVECFADGCQKVKVETRNNRLFKRGHVGIILPLEELRPFMMKPVKAGLDKWHER